MENAEIEQLISGGMSTEFVRVRGDGRHFTAVIVSQAFASHSRLDRQRQVFATLKAAMDQQRLHAITLKTYTPEEWDSTNQEQT